MLSNNISTESKQISESFVSSEKIDNQKKATSEELVASVESKSDMVTISKEAQLLSKAEQDNLRWSKMSQQQLKAEAQRVLAPITNYTDDAVIAKADAEVPNTNDPEILERSKQATAFLKKNASNPFQGVSREKLTSIIYDDSGAYTTNEKISALSEQQRQDAKHWNNIFAKSTSQGSRRGIYEASIDFYNQLTPLERAIDDYPPGYVGLMQSKIEAGDESDDWLLSNSNFTSIFAPHIETGKLSLELLKEESTTQNVKGLSADSINKQ